MDLAIKLEPNGTKDIKDRPKKTRNQKFIPKYSKQWPCLRSGQADCTAFCTVCNSEFIIAHGGSDDCRRHVNGPMHQKKVIAADNVKKSVGEYFINEDRTNIIKAEALFAKYLISHNIPLATADHAGPISKSMFPDSDIAAKYSAGRTKTTAMISLMAAETSDCLSSCLKNSPFSLSTDGSNDGGSETLFPIVIRYFDEMKGEVLSTLLCVASNTDSSTGHNIFSLLNKELEKRSISWENCVAFGCDNASVMTGKHKGVAKYIQEKKSDIFIMGCYCHLIHIAAQNSASKLPYSMDELLIDLYFFLNKSTERQQALKCFQGLCGVESRKIIKHAVTRWLSLEKCIGRLLEQWEPLAEFFKNEKNPPKKIKKVKNNQSKTSEKPNCADSNSMKQTENCKRHLNDPIGECSKKLKIEKKNEPENRKSLNDSIEECSRKQKIEKKEDLA